MQNNSTKLTIILAEQDNVDSPPHASDAARRVERDLRIAVRHIRDARASRLWFVTAH